MKLEGCQECVLWTRSPTEIGFEQVRRPLQRSSVRDILHLQSCPLSDGSGFQTSSSDLLIPSIWYICRGPRRCGVDVSSMERPWRDHGNSMEIPWRDHGETMEIRWRDDGTTVGHPAYRPPKRLHFDIFSIHFSASALKHKKDCRNRSWEVPGDAQQRFWASEGSILRSIFESF